MCKNTQTSHKIVKVQYSSIAQGGVLYLIEYRYLEYNTPKIMP